VDEPSLLVADAVVVAGDVEGPVTARTEERAVKLEAPVVVDPSPEDGLLEGTCVEETPVSVVALEAYDVLADIRAVEDVHVSVLEPEEVELPERGAVDEAPLVLGFSSVQGVERVVK
jgi:hypothetical protein